MHVVDFAGLNSSGFTSIVELQGTYGTSNRNHGIGFSITDKNPSAGIYVTENGGAGSNLMFTTATSYATPTMVERMRIVSDGKVGIGTTNPSTDFSVKEHLLFNDSTRLLTISNNTNTGGINLDGGNTRLYFSGYRALEGNNSGTTLTVGEGYTTTRISSVLNVVDHETILSPDQGGSGGVASRALTIENINDSGWTTDALTSYNATTSYDIRDRASYSFFAAPKNGNILTFASETANNGTLHRFVNLNSSATEPLYRWDFFQYDGSGTGAGDFKVPDKLFQIRVREGVSNVEKFTIKGNGNVGISTTNPLFKLHVNGDIYQDVGYSIYSNANRGWYRGNYTTTGSGVSNGKIVTLNPSHGQTASSNYHYIFELTTIGTSTNSGATYIGVYSADASAWSLRAVSLSGGSSNHPQLSVSGNNFTVYTDHTSNYTIVVSVTTVYNGDADSTAHSLGANYQWQRAVNDLYYNDGLVGIGTGTPSQKLHVQGNLRLTGALYDSNNATGTSGQVLTSTGSATDWKDLDEISGVTGSGTTNYVTKWTDGAGEVIGNSLIYDNGTNVGISTASPSAKLQVAGNTYLNSGSNVWNLIGNNRINFARETYFGYSSSYRILQLGTVGATRAISIGVDVSSNASGSFGGDEIIFPNQREIITPNAADNGYLGLIATDNHNKVRIGNYRWNILNDTPGITIDTSASTNYVGIGTTSPDSKLHIYEAATAPSLLTLHNYTSDILNDGSTGNFIDFKSTDSNTNFTPQARIGMVVQDPAGDGGISSEGHGNFVVYTSEGTDSSGNGVLSEKLRVSPEGNVGIGTTDPVAPLQVVKTGAGIQPSLDVTNNQTAAADVGVSIRFSGITNSSLGKIYSAFEDAGSNSYMSFHTRTSGTPTEKLRIDSSGNVGIGTTGPGGKLHVYGGTTAFTNLSDNTDSVQITRNASVHSHQDAKLFIYDNSNSDYAQKINLAGYSYGLRIEGFVDYGLEMHHQTLGLVLVARSSELVINDSGNDYNFRVEGETDVNLLVCDASLDKVGIGTATPAEKLTVIGDILIDNGVDSTLYLGKGAEGVDGVTKIKSVQTGTDTDQLGIAFNIHPSTAGSAVSEEAMRIAHNGNLGIGTPSPASKLHVYGADPVLTIQDSESTVANASAILRIGESDGSANLNNNFAIKFVGTASGGDLDFSRYNNTTIANQGLRIKHDGNVGIGTTSPNDKLEIYGNMRVRGSDGFGANSTANYNPSFVAYPGGGKIGSASSSQAGYVKITLPQSWTNTMMQFSVDIFEYQTNKAKTFVLAGYNYAPSSSWANTSAMVLAGDDGTTYKVQFGHDGSKCAIYISKGSDGASSSWTYPYVVVRDASFGFLNTDISNWIDGWSVSFSTATLSGITQTRDVNTQVTGTGTSQYITKWNSTGTELNDSVIVQDSNNIGIGTPTPDVKLEVVDTSPTDGIIADFVNDTNAAGTTAAIKLSNADSEACDVVLGANRVNANFGSDFFVSLSDNVDGTNQERFRITEAGNVGIGTATPRALLDVRTTVDGDSFPSRITSTDGSFTDEQKLGIEFAQNTLVLNQFYSKYDISLGGWGFGFKGYSSGLTDELFTIGANGKVGIGTTDPRGPLEVHAASDSTLVIERFTSNGIQLRADNSVDSAIRLGFEAYTYEFKNGSGTSRLHIDSSGNVGIGTNSPTRKLTVHNSAAGSIANFLHYTDASNYQGLYIDVSQTTDIVNLKSSGASAGGFAFFAGNNEKVRFDSTGNVGIGTTDPSQALTVAGKIDTVTAMGTAGQWSSSQIRLETTNTVDTTGWQGISFDTSTTDNYGWSIGVNRSGSGRGSFRVYEHVNNATGTERFTIEQDGNVGIGTANPTKKLDVNGDVKIAGDTLNAGFLRAYGSNYSVGNNNYGVFLGTYSGGTSGTSISPGEVILSTQGKTGWDVGDGLGRIRFFLGDTSGVGVRDVAKIEAVNEVGNGSTTTTASAGLAFYTSPYNSQVVERMRIKQSGKIRLNEYGEGDFTSGTVTYRLAVNASGDVMEIPIGDGPVDGNGIEDYVARWTDTETLGIGKIRDDNSTVAINTAPDSSYMLKVAGNGYFSGTLTEASSLAIKENIENFTPSIDKINKIRPVKYNKKGSDKKEIGLIAEELEELFPELVEKDENGNPSGVNYSRAVTVLLGGFKELYKELQEIKKRI